MKRVGAILGFLLVAAVILAAAPSAQYQIRVAVDLVNINFSATDKNGRMVPGLTADDFTIEEDGKKQQVSLFARERELPLTLALLVDVSPSVEPVFEEEKRTASAFLRSVLGKRDLALVIAFDRYVTLTQDYSEDLPTLTRAIETIDLSKGGTSLFDAVYLAANDKLAREAGRKAIVILSDGIDTTSKYDMGKAMIAAQKSDAVIYSISNSGSPRTLRVMSEETGGAFFKINRAGDYEKIFDQIALELRTQYSLAYQSSNPARDGKFRQIKIVPKNANLLVRARKGYYAPTEASSR
jgi:Ca-activated chloride channel family protein